MKLTTIRPSLAALVIMIGGAAVSVTTPAFWHAPSGKSWSNGESTAAYEKALDTSLSIRDFSISFWANIQYFVFGEGRPGVLVGAAGWLISKEEFDQPASGEAAQQEKLALITRVRDRLSSLGIQLVVVLLPDKSRVYPEFLGRYERPDGVQSRYRSFREALLANNIVTPDASSALMLAKESKQVFLKTDTHWTPDGADAVAQLIATTLKSTESAEVDRTIFTTAVEGEADHFGDLLKFIPLGPFAFLGPAADRLPVRVTRPAADSGLGLFDEVAIPFVLVGTSYSANPKWNFAGALSEHLSSDVLNAAEEGKGPMVPMIDYLSGTEFAESPPRTVIWEIPERFLPVHYELNSEVLQ